MNQESHLPEGLNLQFHHVGVACRDLDGESALFEFLGYEREGEDFVDELQGVRGRFLTKDNQRIELLVALSADKSVLTPWLQRGVKLYHMAYEVDSLPEAISSLVENRAQLASKPTPAVAFGGREIAFLMLPNLLLIELISRH